MIIKLSKVYWIVISLFLSSSFVFGAYYTTDQILNKTLDPGTTSLRVTPITVSSSTIISDSNWDSVELTAGVLETTKDWGQKVNSTVIQNLGTENVKVSFDVAIATKSKTLLPNQVLAIDLRYQVLHIQSILGNQLLSVTVTY